MLSSNISMTDCNKVTSLLCHYSAAKKTWSDTVESSSQSSTSENITFTRRVNCQPSSTDILTWWGHSEELEIPTWDPLLCTTCHIFAYQLLKNYHRLKYIYLISSQLFSINEMSSHSSLIDFIEGENYWLVIAMSPPCLSNYFTFECCHYWDFNIHDWNILLNAFFLYIEQTVNYGKELSTAHTIKKTCF